jgi:hypothetical protein
MFHGLAAFLRESIEPIEETAAVSHRLSQRARYRPAWDCSLHRT